MDLNLAGKNAVICGSSQGIGKAIAMELAALGATVTLFSRDIRKLEGVLAELDRPASQRHSLLVADFNHPENVKEVIDSYSGDHDHIHILVNNSGGPPPGRAIDASPEDFQLAFSRHILSNQHIVKALVPGMKDAGYGRIINIVSTSVKVPIPGLGVSNTIRGAVASWAKTLSTELAPYGITVNNILPGYTNTARLRSLIESTAKEKNITVNEVEQSFITNIPARRFADPRETAALAAFLASPSAGYITGTSIRVDGGSTPSI